MMYPSIYYDNWHGHDAIMNENWRSMIDHDAIDARRMKVDEQSATLPFVPQSKVADIVKDRIRYAVDVQGEHFAESLDCIGIY